jgi:chemotaxis family two-component system sensor kinase Cph1
MPGINRLAWEIRPTSLDDLGLQTAVEQLVQEWCERSKLKFDLQLMLNDRRLPATVETTLYRVLQEAINNVVKHADATKVGVILEANEKEVSLIVEDDGRGFSWNPDHASSSSRLGLLGMRERLALVGGSLEIESGQDNGTTIIVHAPI